MIIDVHAHVFEKINGRIKVGKTSNAGHGRVRAGNEIIRILPPLNTETCHTTQMLIGNMDMAVVDKAVLLQGSFYGECNLYTLEAVRMYPERLTAAAFLDPWSPDAEEAFQFIINNSEFTAVKLECSESAGFFGVYDDISLKDKGIQWLWQEMEKRGLVLTLDLGSIGSRSYQTEIVEKIAMDYPGLKIVIAHLGQPNHEMEKDPLLYDMWLRQIELGRLDNIWFDTAALPVYFSHETFPYRSAEKYFKIAVDRIGAGKIMWGTDIPGLLIRSTYCQLINLCEIYTECLSQNEREKIKCTNAINVYFKKKEAESS